MPKPKWNLNTIYISERLQESLRPISRCAMTTVVAPMGYGKTTAVNWYLEERAKAETLKIIRISVYSDNLAIFWKSVQEAFARAGFPFLREYPCPTDAAGGGLMVDDLCHELAGETSCYIFIDDFHLLTDRRAPLFLCMLANRLPVNVHLIVASRDRFLPAAEMVRLGAKAYQIGTDQLRLNHTELAIYAHRCGTDLSDSQVESLLYSSEGWFSAVYLNLRTLSERGVLPSRHSNIYATFTAAMIDPLPEKQREFLAVMGLADEFTVEMAQCITGDADAGQILSMLTVQNAFVTRLPDGVTYRFHHMMKECAERSFLAMQAETQQLYWERFGLWYEEHRQYLHAITAYRKSENYNALLRVIRNDAGILLASLKPEDVLTTLDKCPAETLKANPFAILVLMRRMFTWRQIPKMLELKALLLTAIEEHPELSEEERGNLLGECDLILSFLCYNDISAMSRLHRSASSRMSRPAISIQSSGGWTFGSPSVLMMFYRAPGELQSELAEMDECMPHYYKITNNHGQGAETIMRAEALFCQGHFTDAHIELERAYAQVKDNRQINMELCCDFLSRRLSLHTDVEQRYTFAERYAALLHHHDASWINLWSATSAYYHALQGETDKIPEIFLQHRLSAVNMLAPGKPMMEMIENQVYLAQGAYARVVGRSAELLPVCEAMHYALVALHIRIQTAAAYAQLHKPEEAHTWLRKALSDAEPDGFVMPFVENYERLKPLLTQEIKNDLIAKITELGEAATARIAVSARPAAFDALTPREFEIVELMAQRLSNREIAETLYLSEGSVKQYVNQIYSKLHIEGDTRTKRKQLAELLRKKT
ncbi:LuxR C-terminal-related transcriptional regulator [uncultured Clostridium sp.]|uniref:helix-turn-helix transcriptional regulator n=1 Tax=uncultured Clostridium sp. TaxID=59620 RepID=UPI0025F1C001|nr:LuxR C-terminal-related transcriptional regulator [uncultured Clostridium sp.]